MTDTNLPTADLDTTQRNMTGAGMAQQRWDAVPYPAGMQYGWAPPQSTHPAGKRLRTRRWFWPVVLSAAAVVALLGGGVAGYAIGHSAGSGQSQSTTIPGGGTGSNGGSGSFPGGSSGSGSSGSDSSGSSGFGSSGSDSSGSGSSESGSASS